MKRKEAKTWINTGMINQVWTAIHNAGHYRNHNWVIKVDVDAVFFPHKLLNVLRDVEIGRRPISWPAQYWKANFEASGFLAACIQHRVGVRLHDGKGATRTQALPASPSVTYIGTITWSASCEHVRVG